MAVGRRRISRVSRAAGCCALGAVAAVALGAALAPWTFSTNALLEEISGQLNASSGLYIAAKGRSTFSLLPRPHITIDSIAFADPAAALTIEAERLHGNVLLLPLLAGRLEIADVELLRPRSRSISTAGR